jgi:hypothetical protein
MCWGTQTLVIAPAVARSPKKFCTAALWVPLRMSCRACSGASQDRPQEERVFLSQIYRVEAGLLGVV